VYLNDESSVTTTELFF